MTEWVDLAYYIFLLYLYLAIFYWLDFDFLFQQKRQ